MKKLNSNGITLMALVITIIILIILASIGTYSGIQVVKSSQFTAFSTELKIMQTQANKLYEEKKNGNSDVDALGKTISGSTTVQTHATKAFNASGITDTSDYKYFDTETIKSLNIEGVEGEFFVNIEKRSVVSYDGFEYEGKIYYTLEQLPDGLYNVEHNTSEQQPDFDVDYELLENGKCKISVNNIKYNGNINKWKIEYKKENEEDWKQSNNYSFMIDELVNYRVKIANNNTESREKQIISLFLPSEYQEVEYIESTGTQYIDLNTKLSNRNKVDVDYALKDKDMIGAIFGAQFNKNGFTINTNVESNSRFGSYSYIAYTDSKFKQNSNTRYNIVFSKNGFYQDGNKLWSPIDNEFETNINGYLFKANGANSVGPMKIYRFKLYDSEDLIRNFIPCYRRSDNKPGLYDLVTSEFYTNQGTGEFDNGKDIDSGETIKQIIINNM